MSMEADFRALLANDATLAALVSTRIYPSNYAQNALSPAVRFQKIAGAPGVHMQGSDGLYFDVVQVDARAIASGADAAGASATALSVRDAIVTALHAFDGTQGSTKFQLIQLRDDRGLNFEKTDSQQFYTTSLDFDVIWKAA